MEHFHRILRDGGAQLVAVLDDSVLELTLVVLLSVELLSVVLLPDVDEDELLCDALSDGT